jgi:hypothetical protein
LTFFFLKLNNLFDKTQGNLLADSLPLTIPLFSSSAAKEEMSVNMEIFDTTEINLENTAPYICKHAGWVTGL